MSWKRLSAVGVYTYKLLCLHHIFLCPILYCGYMATTTIETHGPPKVNAYEVFISPVHRNRAIKMKGRKTKNESTRR